MRQMRKRGREREVERERNSRKQKDPYQCSFTKIGEFYLIHFSSNNLTNRLMLAISADGNFNVASLIRIAHTHTPNTSNTST